jgi:hypothetical protein
MFSTPPAIRLPCAAFAILFLLPVSTLAQTPAPEIEARMAKEKEDRKACKIEICKAFASPSEGAPITCNVTKTWLAPEIQTAFLRDKLTWPWGDAQCSAAILISRDALKQAALQPSAAIKLKKHDITCKLASKEPKEGTAYDLKLSIEPTVTFEAGKAIKAEMGWSSIEAPILAKSAIWSATAVDANFGVIANNVVTEINNFFAASCKEAGVPVSR